MLVRGFGLADTTEVAAVFTWFGGRVMADKEPFAERRTFARGLYTSP